MCIPGVVSGADNSFASGVYPIMITGLKGASIMLGLFYQMGLTNPLWLLPRFCLLLGYYFTVCLTQKVIFHDTLQWINIDPTR